MRKNRLLVVAIACLCLLLATACAGNEQSGVLSDATEAEVTSAEDATPEGDSTLVSSPLDGITASSRVVVLSRSLSEMWLLSGGTLVGATDDSLDLSDLPEDTVSIGSLSKPSLEQVLACEPDLVILSEDLPSHKEMCASLDAAGIPVLSLDINSFDDYDAAMLQLTSATGRDDLYEQNVTSVRAQIDDVLANAPQTDGGTYLALRTSTTKNKVLKSDYFACAMLDDLGMTNIAGDESPLDDLSFEAIAQADPDWIFVVFQGEDDEAKQAFEQAFSEKPVWNELTATKRGHVVMLPKDLFQYKPNARWGEAYAYLSHVLYGSEA